MKKKSYAFLLTLTLGALCFLGLPWWAIVPIAAVVAMLISQSGGAAFSTAFAAGSALWYGAAMLMNAPNLGMLASKIGQLFMGLTGAHLLAITGLLGGILAGLGALSGHYLRAIFVKTRPKRYYERKYY